VRSTDFQQAPYFTQEELLDIDQDYQTMLLQEASADAINALRIPAVETNLVELPDAATRANKFLVFNGNGDVGLSEGSGNNPTTYYAGTKSAGNALAATLPNGATVIVDRDETAGGVQTRRVVTSGVLGSPVNELDAGQVEFTQAESAFVPSILARSIRDVCYDRISVKDFGAIGDGSLHPLSERFASLIAAQVFYPFAASLTEQIDHHAIQTAIYYAHNNHTGRHPTVHVPCGRYWVAKIQFYVHVRLEGEGEGTAHSAAGLSHGWQSELMQVAGTNDHMFVFDVNSSSDPAKQDKPSPGAGKYGISDVSITKLSLRGVWTGPGDVTTTQGSAIFLDDAYFIQGCDISRLQIANFAGSCIEGNELPLPGIIKNVWGRQIGGSILKFTATSRITHMLDFDQIQGDFVVGPLIDIDGSPHVAGGGSFAGCTFRFANIKHEIDSSATSTTAYSPNTIRLRDLDRASVLLENVNPQTSNPLGGGAPVSNAVVQLVGTKTPYINVISSRMGSSNATADYLVDDQVNGITITKKVRNSRYLAPIYDILVGHQDSSVIEEVRVQNDDTAALDAHPRFRRRASGKFEWGSGSATPDVSLERTGANRLALDDAFQARKLLARGQTALVDGDFTLAAGWGSTATVSADANSTDQRFRVTVTANGAGLAANPNLTLIFKDTTVPWAVAPVAVAGMATASTGAIAHITTGSRSGVSTFVLTYRGTPVAGQTYIIDCVIMG
jgi:hypothetical protein